ncbi:hypothetical protein [Amycolatopsis sp. CA-230715]|uniref:hypothetical protein n=1 Tax=Amycolatopsis sp. CA-230715 TaxID=2745196 RepID=UPI001C009D44|nr:hypothetical protein [Amycolatopsis sp. CA-230715]QWF77947.1 hypothetical protein HUW46_01340 [Amycolatopsis sp. CA-230715]
MNDRAPFPGHRRACEYCGSLIPLDQSASALVPDSSVLDPEDPSGDGQRQITACGSAHLDALIERARAAWIPEQRWFGELCRASTRPGATGATMAELGARARMPAEHVRRAVLWNSRRETPLCALPGGQVLPGADLETTLDNR